MKAWILAAVMILGLTATAQKREHERGERLTPEQRVELQVKKLTLELDLNKKQQGEIKQLLTTKSIEREKMMEKRKAEKEAEAQRNSEERFAMRSKMLDEKIAMKAEMKKILNEEQFNKFEELEKERQKKLTKRVKKLKKRDRD